MDLVLRIGMPLAQLHDFTRTTAFECEAVAALVEQAAQRCVVAEALRVARCQALGVRRDILEVDLDQVAHHIHTHMHVY